MMFLYTHKLVIRGFSRNLSRQVFVVIKTTSFADDLFNLVICNRRNTQSENEQRVSNFHNSMYAQ